MHLQRLDRRIHHLLATVVCVSPCILQSRVHHWDRCKGGSLNNVPMLIVGFNPEEVRTVCTCKEQPAVALLFNDATVVPVHAISESVLSLA